MSIKFIFGCILFFLIKIFGFERKLISFFIFCEEFLGKFLFISLFFLKYVMFKIV